MAATNVFKISRNIAKDDLPNFKFIKLQVSILYF